VSRLGKADYRTISEAIRQSPSGAKILVQPGLYSESVTITKPVEIIGQGKGVTLQSMDGNCIRMQTTKATVKNLIIRGLSGLKRRQFYAVDVPKGVLTVEACVITSNSLACIGVYGSGTYLTLRNCWVRDSPKGGLFAFDRAKGVVEMTSLYGHALAGVEVKDSANFLIRRTSIYNCKASGVLAHRGGKATIDACDIHSNGIDGVAVSTGANVMIKNSKIHGNKRLGLNVWEKGMGNVDNCDIYEHPADGVAIQSQGNLAIRKSRITRNKMHAIMVSNLGMATVEYCDLRYNTRGSWFIARGCRVVRRNNQETFLAKPSTRTRRTRKGK